jgi:hypothetical protein
MSDSQVDYGIYAKFPQVFPFDRDDGIASQNGSSLLHSML